MARGINRTSLSLAILLFVLSSCGRGLVYSDSRVIGSNTWNMMDVLTFNVPVEDTVTSQNIYFTLRTGSSYPFRNIFLFISTTAPDGKTISDTLEYNVTDEKGQWLGKGFGDIKELDLPYASNVYFPLKGMYQFTVRHGMRPGDLKGVYDFGIRIVKIKK